MNGENSMNNQNANMENGNNQNSDGMSQNNSNQGQRMNNNGLRNNSPMERARQDSQRGFNQNPYINQNSGQSSGQNMGQNPYYNNSNANMNNNNMNNSNMNNMPNQMAQAQSSSSLFDTFDTSNFIKGALLGAVGAYLLTNETAQKTIFKGAAKATDMFQAGMEEMKERFEDAKAEMDAEK